MPNQNSIYSSSKSIIMKRLFTILIALLAIETAKANDGAFFSKGNHLIPITESTISVKKEILTITRVADTISNWECLFKVNVYYEFFNPGPAKDLLVGFESPMPDGNGYDGTLDEAYAGQPFTYDFNVVMNGKKLPYQTAHVLYNHKKDDFDFTMKTEDYYKKGKIVDMSKEQYRKTIEGIFKGEDVEEYVNWYGYLFYYVYHFNAHFNEGLNIIEHTYTVKGSALVVMDYMFDYILTAANRWANNGIDDFTLVLNMGDHESFSVEPTFFETPDEWSFTGKGRVGELDERVGECEHCPLFHVQSGNLVFNKKNFHPEGELHVMRDNFGFNLYDYENADKEEINGFVDAFKTKYHHLVLDEDWPIERSVFSSEQKRIMKNVPFAYRGYVFKDKGLQRFFESTAWYVPNPDYQADMTKFDKDEKEWVMFWSK